ncbi:MAG: hypothetical protein FJZ01_07045 [Candidatus Sericytochromatia bacterium]|nr:hypothetical protein [Candidatus Tanganyikabacteria bacterium]
MAFVAVVVPAAPAAAEWEWLPEGEFFGRVSAPVRGPARAGPDAVFEIVEGKFGTRLVLAPGLALRAVGELLPDPGRRAGDLRLGYLEYLWEPVGTFRGGQVPLLGDADDQVVGDPILGSGLLARSGFLAECGLGLAWHRGIDVEWATASVEVAGTYTEGLLGSVGLPENKLFLGVQGPGPALHGRATAVLAEDLTAHLYGRYGTVQDQQLASTVTTRIGDVALALTAGASISSPPGLPIATDAGGQVRARYNLGAIDPAWWRSDIVLRSGVVWRNVSNTPTLDPRYPEATPRTDLLSTLALIHRITDFASVALDLTDARRLDAAGAADAVLLGARAGVKF